MCPDCGGKLDKLISGFTPSIWKPLTLEHIAPEPMTFNSKKELIQECQKRGVSSGALL